MDRVIGYNNEFDHIVGCSGDIDREYIINEYNNVLYRKFWNVEPDEEVLRWNIGGGSNEFVIEGYKGDVDELRSLMYKDGYVLYNRVCDDGRLYFVREDILVRMLEGLRSDDCVLNDHCGEVYSSMDMDMMFGLEQLLRDPLGFEWEWHKFKKEDATL